MATITLNFSTEDAARISGALERGQFTAIDANGDFLPATAADAKNFIMKRLISFVRDSERQVARDVANETVRQHMDTDIPVIIT